MRQKSNDKKLTQIWIKGFSLYMTCWASDIIYIKFLANGTVPVDTFIRPDSHIDRVRYLNLAVNVHNSLIIVFLNEIFKIPNSAAKISDLELWKLENNESEKIRNYCKYKVESRTLNFWLPELEIVLEFIAFYTFLVFNLMLAKQTAHSLMESEWNFLWENI